MTSILINGFDEISVSSSVLSFGADLSSEPFNCSRNEIAFDTGAPRIVSTEDLDCLPVHTSMPKTTPLDMLRSLVQQKKRQRSSTRALNMLPCPATMAADPASTPSCASALQSSLHERPTKKSKIEPKPNEAEQSALHRACCRSTVTVEEIQNLLRSNPSSAAKSVSLRSNKIIWNHWMQKSTEKQINEPYSLPLNLAIKHGASDEVLTELINAAPQVLSMPDGAEREVSLAVLLKSAPKNLAMLDKFLLKNPRSVATKDRQSNTVTHVACQRGASLNVLRHLHIMFPESLSMRNFHVRTPLDIAQQTSGCDEKVAAFLLSKLQSDMDAMRDDL